MLSNEQESTNEEASSLERLTISLLNGDERFSSNGHDFGFDVRDFWRWSFSNLVSNATRGVLAEYIVAKAMGINTNSARVEWDPYDLVTDEGIKIEVKASGYLQSWHQSKLSNIRFSVRSAQVFDPDTNSRFTESARSAHVYVFALHHHRDKGTVNPLDVTQWSFYAVPTSALPAQKSISLARLSDLGFEPLAYNEVAESVRGIAFIKPSPQG